MVFSIVLYPRAALLEAPLADAQCHSPYGARARSRVGKDDMAGSSLLRFHCARYSVSSFFAELEEEYVSGNGGLLESSGGVVVNDKDECDQHHQMSSSPSKSAARWLRAKYERLLRGRNKNMQNNR